MTNPPAFTGWEAVAALHKNGFFAWEPQDAPGVFKEPTHILRETGGGEMLPTEEGIVPKFFAGTQMRPFSQPGTSEYLSRTVNVELDGVTLALGLRCMYGEPVAGVDPAPDVITPYSNRQWSQFLPARAICGYWYVPTIGHVKFTDGQIYQIQGTVPEGNELITAQFGFHAGLAEFFSAAAGGYVAPAIAFPDFEGAFTPADASLLFDGQPLGFEGGLTFQFNRPIDAGGRSGGRVVSFKPGSGYLDATISTTLTGGRPDLVQVARAKPRQLKPLELRLVQGDVAAGGVSIVTKFPTAEITSASAPISDGAVTTGIEFAAVIPNPAAKAFNIELNGAYS